MHYKVPPISAFGSKFFYPLTEVASLTSISERDLLQYVAKDKVKALAFINTPNVSFNFHFPSKDSFEVVHILNSEKRSSQVQANYMAFLHLNPKTAEKIRKFGQAEQRKFIEAHNRTGESNESLGNSRRTLAICLHDAITHSTIDHLKRINLPISGHFYQERRLIFQRPVTISNHQIYLHFIELSALIQRIADKLGNENSITQIQNQYFEKLTMQNPPSACLELVNFQKKEHHSTKLIGLVETSHYFWDTIYFEVENFPKARVIEEFLIDNFDFDTETAKSAVKLITPKYAREGPDLFRQLEHLGQFTPSLRAMVAVSDQFYSNTQLNENAPIISTLRLKQWLINYYGFSPKLASCAAQIIQLQSFQGKHKNINTFKVNTNKTTSTEPNNSLTDS
jgi:hypothetical protein